MGLQNVNENVFHGFGNLVIWLWKSLGGIVEELGREREKRGKSVKKRENGEDLD